MSTQTKQVSPIEDGMKTLAQFIYTPTPSGNRRATGSHWRGHKLSALITIREGATIWKATNHEESTYFFRGRDYSEIGTRICRATGEVMDNKWFFNRAGVSYYVLDHDVPDVQLASAKVRKVRV